MFPAPRSCHTHRSLALGSVLAVLTGACHLPAAQTAAGADDPAAPLSARAIGVPSELITVVPFELYKGAIIFQGGIDRIHGKVILDTGAPYVWLNDYYARRGSDGVDSALTPGTAPVRIPVTVRAVHVGTFHQHVDSTDVGPPEPYTFKGNVTNGLITHGDRFEGFGPLEIGSLGLAALEPFETIVDYTHRRLIFIKLDSAGRRLAAPPGLTPVATTSLIPKPKYWWGVEAMVGEVRDTLILDVGTPDGELLDKTFQRLAPHLRAPDSAGAKRATVDSLVIAGRTLRAIPFVRGDEDADILGALSLQQLGVVGFNFRARQLVVYR